jgi:hypothetical protein
VSESSDYLHKNGEMGGKTDASSEEIARFPFIASSSFVEKPKHILEVLCRLGWGGVFVTYYVLNQKKKL